MPVFSVAFFKAFRRYASNGESQVQTCKENFVSKKS